MLLYGTLKDRENGYGLGLDHGFGLILVITLTSVERNFEQKIDPSEIRICKIINYNVFDDF